MQTHKAASPFPVVVNVFENRRREGFSNNTLRLITIITANMPTINISWMLSTYQAKSKSFPCIISCNPHHNAKKHYDYYPHLKDKETEA